MLLLVSIQYLWWCLIVRVIVLCTINFSILFVWHYHDTKTPSRNTRSRFGQTRISGYTRGGISCDVCQQQYLAETTDPRKRVNNHRSSVRTKKDLTAVTHFNGNNNCLEDMRVVVIDHDPSCSDTKRKEKETLWKQVVKSYVVMTYACYSYAEVQTVPTNLPTLPGWIGAISLLDYELHLCPVVWSCPNTSSTAIFIIYC